MKTLNVQLRKISRARRSTSNAQLRRRVWILISCALPFFVQPLFSEEVANELSTAAQASAEGVPEIAVTRLRPLLKTNLPDAEWRNVAGKLAEALLAAQQPAEALTLLEDPRLGEIPSTKFWRAQALAELHRWDDALSLYQAIGANKASPFRNDAIFGTAEMLRALARPEEALQTLSAIIHDKEWSIRARLRSAELFLNKSDADNARRMLDEMNPTASAERKERRFLRARLELIRRHPERAIATFESLVKKPKGANHALVLAALFGVGDARLQLKTPELGDDFLEDFIDHHPHDLDLSQIFAKLDELYRAERKPARVELEKWTREHEQPRRAFALWYLARIEMRAGHRDRALQLFSDLRKSNAKTVALAAGLLEFAKLELEDRHFNDAFAILEEARSLQPEPALRDRIDLMAAEAYYNAKQFESASAAFEQIAHSASSFANISMWNASLGWLQLGDYARFLADYNELEKRSGDRESSAELRLEEGLVQAAKGDKNAADSLQRFLREFPDNPRTSEAWVALAELAFHASPPRLEEARRSLTRATESKPTAIATERSDYLMIWIEESGGGNDNKVIERADRFLKQHPDSTFAGDVRMKLAEAYYRRQDFPNAQTQFEILAQQNPSGLLAEKALFFAAESAMSTMASNSLDHAIVLFDRVVQLKGELRWAARNEQAVIERKLGKPQEALVLYNEVLKNEAKPGEKREALCGKGDIYFDMGTEDGKNYKRAIEAYEQLAADSGEPGHWRNQALFKKGTCLEKTADRDGALATFYRVLEDQTRPNRSPEFFWFYRAGFNAARLLEDEAKWESAAAVYEKLVAAGGARSDEAKARLSRLRLEHFLWKD
jgi:outer membrane protein assembly factor BamD (BamD/ComL family)